MAKRIVNIGNRDYETFNIRSSGSGSRYFFHNFSSYDDLKKASQDIVDDLRSQNITWLGFTDYINNGGANTPSVGFEGSDNKDLLNNPTSISTVYSNTEFQNALQELSTITQNIQLGASSSKSKLIMTEKPIGVFNFASASTGLYRKQEYFSPEENKLVDMTEVFGKIPNFFYQKNGKNVPLELRQEGTTEMLRINPNAKLKLASNGMFYTEPIRYGKHSLKFATTTKKVYLVRSEVKDISKRGQEKYVDLYVTNGMPSSIAPQNLIYRALPSIIVSQILEKAGYKVRISKVTAKTQSGANSNTMVYTSILKDYGQPLDLQRLAIQTGDPRIKRWSDFADDSTFYRAIFGQDLGAGYGSSPTGSDYDNLMKNYYQWVGIKAKEGGAKMFNKNIKLHLSGTITLSNDPYDTQMQRVTEKVKDILDKVSIEFSGVRISLEEALKRDLPTMSKQEILNNFEQSLRNTQPIRPDDPDLRFYSDAEFQKQMDLYNDRMNEFNQLKTTI